MQISMILKCTIFTGCYMFLFVSLKSVLERKMQSNPTGALSLIKTIKSNLQVMMILTKFSRKPIINWFQWVLWRQTNNRKKGFKMTKLIALHKRREMVRKMKMENKRRKKRVRLMSVKKQHSFKISILFSMSSWLTLIWNLFLSLSFTLGRLKGLRLS